MIHCTFAGHREVYCCGVEKRLFAALERLLKEDMEFCFYVGGMGEFDTMSARAVRRLKKRHPEKKIQLFLVLPYMTQRVNEDKLLATLYDDIIIPMELAECHYKSAITKRNRWIIDRCSNLICFVQRDYGGAYATYHYTKKKGLTIENVAVSIASEIG